MDKPLPTPSELSLAAAKSPQDRLATSRKALVRHMSRDSRPETTDARPTDSSHVPLSGPASSGARLPNGTFAMLKRGVRGWWRHHPANFAVSLANPLLGRYAKQSPFRLLAISAGVGAALVLLKPWRLVSMGGLALATLKSSEFTGLLTSLLSAHPDDVEPPAET